MARRPGHGWRGCCHASRRCWSLWPWPARCARGLDSFDQRRRLPGSSRGGVSWSRPRGRRASGRRVWRNSRRDGVGKTRAFHSASSTLWVIWTRPANFHTGQQQTIAASQAGQMAASDYAPPQSRRFPLPRGRRPQMGSRHSHSRPRGRAFLFKLHDSRDSLGCHWALSLTFGSEFRWSINGDEGFGSPGASFHRRSRTSRACCRDASRT